jgi:hypothetical protein
LRQRRLSARALLAASLAAAAFVAAAGCSSGSSGGAAPSASPSRGPDRAAIQLILDNVLSGLRSATSISGHGSVGDAATSLHRASAELDSAGQALNPAPTGVPSAAALGVSTGLLRVSGLLEESATCLDKQVAATHPSTASCLPPLRSAERQDAGLARALIGLAQYGQRSPKTFERLLVAALRGR